MDSTKTDVVDRVRKILAKTERAGCSPEEAANAFNLASRLMTEHNLEMAEVQVSATAAAAEASWTTEDAYDTGVFFLEDSLASSICVRYFFVRSYTTKRYAAGKNRTVLRFFGKPENVETARFVFGALKDAFSRLFSEYRRASHCELRDRRPFITGVCTGFSAKLDEDRQCAGMERDIVQGKAAGSTGLAVVSLAKETSRAFQAAYPSMGRSTRSFSSGSGNSSAVDAGVRAGKNLNLNRSVGGGGQKRLGY